MLPHSLPFHVVSSLLVRMLCMIEQFGRKLRNDTAVWEVDEER